MTKKIFLIVSETACNISNTEKKQIAHSMGFDEQVLDVRAVQVSSVEEAEEKIRGAQPIGYEVRVMWWDEHLWAGLGDVDGSTRYYAVARGNGYRWETKSQRRGRHLNEVNDSVSAGLMGRDD